MFAFRDLVTHLPVGGEMACVLTECTCCTCGGITAGLERDRPEPHSSPLEVLRQQLRQALSLA